MAWCQDNPCDQQPNKPVQLNVHGVFVYRDLKQSDDDNMSFFLLVWDRSGMWGCSPTDSREQRLDVAGSESHLQRFHQGAAETRHP